MKVFLVLTIMCLVSVPTYGKEQEFPRQFHGTWGSSSDSCGAEYSDMRISIDTTTVDYWESTGIIEELFNINENEISVTLAMSGEGEIWKRRLTFQIKEEGFVLIEKLEEIKPIKRYRCN